MPSKSSSFDASASALGYLYQCRFALLLGLQKASDASHSISIEKLDDVSFSNVATSGIEDPVKLFQLKHHIKEGGGTSNSSLDVWKSLRVWAIHLRQAKVDLKNCTFVLVTTSQSLPSHAISLLRGETGSRRSEAARAALELAGSRSKNKTVQDCFASLMKLSEKKRKMLFERIIIADNSLNVQSLTSEIERELWSAVDTKHVSAFVERLEGWWFSVVIDHLADKTSASIPLKLLNAQVHSLREKFKRDNLPPDLLDGDVPDQEKDLLDQRTFVKQLRLIRIAQGRITKAQENHYRAVAQRSRWVRNQLLELNELDEFELRLIREWEEKLEILKEGTEGADDDSLNRIGDELYQWTQMTAVTFPTLFIRPQFQAPYLTRGTYHMLSDQKRLGWHPNFQTLL